MSERERKLDEISNWQLETHTLGLRDWIEDRLAFVSEGFTFHPGEPQKTQESALEIQARQEELMRMAEMVCDPEAYLDNTEEVNEPERD